MRCEQHNCKYLKKHSYGIPEILTICYEIKVSKEDFKSKNGHNFIGNLNYYVVPYSIYEDIKDIAPDDIGIIVYYDGNQGGAKYPFIGLRKRKECAFKKMSDKEQKWIILSVLKRVRRSKNV